MSDNGPIRLKESMNVPGVRAQYVSNAEYGDKVRYTVRDWRKDRDIEVGEGVFELHWLGIEECWNVRRFDGTKVHLFPYKGDTMEKIDHREE